MQSCRALNIHKRKLKLLSLLFLLLHPGIDVNEKREREKKSHTHTAVILKLQQFHVQFSSSVQLTCHPSVQWMHRITCNLARVEQTTLDNWSIDWNQLETLFWLYRCFECIYTRNVPSYNNRKSDNETQAQTQSCTKFNPNNRKFF